MRIQDTLALDHRNLEMLIDDLASTPSTDPMRRRKLFGRVQSLLQGHARAEEESVYRPLRLCVPNEVKTLEAYEEHHIADLMLQELASDCPGGTGWSAKVRVFNEMLRHHIKEEEVQLFPLLEQSFDSEALHDMAREFELIKHERLEAFLGPMRRATPAFAGRATVSAQAAAGRYLRRGELYLRRRLGRGAAGLETLGVLSTDSGSGVQR